jgi:hypothetical protein
MSRFAESAPQLSLELMAEALSTDDETGIDRADLCAEQLATVWREEAQRQGPADVERFARRLLVGELRRDLPEGWRSDWKSAEARPAMARMTATVARWSCDVDLRNDGGSARVFSALLEGGKNGSIPEGWLPSTADDPLLVEIFRQHWSKTN